MIKEDRSIWMYILLAFITCGIYSYYFIYTIARDTNTMCDSDGKSTGGLLMFILLSFITCGIYTWYWYYTLGNRLAANAPRYGLDFQENGTTVLLWLLFGSLLCGIGIYISMNIIIKNINAMARAYNRGNTYRPEQNVVPDRPAELVKDAEKKRCPSCNNRVSENALFCRICGTQLTTQEKKEGPDQANCCPNCGQAVDEAERFCTLCGTSLTSESVSGTAIQK